MTTRTKQDAAGAKQTRKNRTGRRFLGWFGTGKSRKQDTPPSEAAPQTQDAKAQTTAAAAGPSMVQPRPQPDTERAAPPARGNEVADLVHSLRRHIDHQSDRSERLLQSLDGLPDALRSLPESNRNSERMIQVMQANLQQQQVHADQITEAMSSVVDASRHRDQTIEMLQQQLLGTQEKDAKLVNGFTMLGETMQKISAIQEKSADVLHRIADTASQAEGRMRDVVEISRRQTRMGVFTGAAVAVVLLAMTAFIAVSATRLATLPAGTRSTPAAIEAPRPADQAPELPAPRHSTRAEGQAITPAAAEDDDTIELDLMDASFSTFPDPVPDAVNPAPQSIDDGEQPLVPSTPASAPQDTATADSAKLSTATAPLSTERQAAATPATEP